MAPWTLIGSSVTAQELIDLVVSRKARCLGVMVDSIAADHGEALVDQLQSHAPSPAVVLSLERTDWLKSDANPLDRVDAVLESQSFGTGVLINALQAITEGQTTRENTDAVLH